MSMMNIALEPRDIDGKIIRCKFEVTIGADTPIILTPNRDGAVFSIPNDKASQIKIKTLPRGRAMYFDMEGYFEYIFDPRNKIFVFRGHHSFEHVLDPVHKIGVFKGDTNVDNFKVKVQVPSKEVIITVFLSRIRDYQVLPDSSPMEFDRKPLRDRAWDIITNKIPQTDPNRSRWDIFRRYPAKPLRTDFTREENGYSTRMLKFNDLSPSDKKRSPLSSSGFFMKTGSKVGVDDIKNVKPDTHDFIFELNIGVPRAITVSIPNSIISRLVNGNVSPLPFLVYFPPAPQGNVDNPDHYYREKDIYPWSFDFMAIPYIYLNYVGSHLHRDLKHTFNQSSFSKGVKYQVSHAKKEAIIVIPSGKRGEKFGQFTNLKFVHQILREIQFWAYRKWASNNEPPSEIGYTALGAFSNGCVPLGEALSHANTRTDLYNEILKEIYLFDPVNEAGPTGTIVDNILFWHRRDNGNNDKKRTIRLYHSTPKQRGLEIHLKKIIDRSEDFEDKSFYLDSTDETRSVIGLKEAIDDLVSEPTPGESKWRYRHHFIPATMMVNAMLRSGFPDKP